MTRVWSLSRTEESNQNRLFVVWKSHSKLLSFDSGYESSLNSHSEPEFDNNFDAFEESEDYSNVNQENQYSEVESTQTTSFLHSRVQRVQSSPIPIPNNSRNRNRAINHSKSSLSTHSNHSFTSSTLSLQSIDSVHCLIGHPPYDCGCIRGHRYPFLAENIQQNNQSSPQSANLLPLSLICNDRRDNADTGDKKRYPLPDIISSSQNRSLMNEIIREIGSDLRRISKDFITTRDQTIESPNPSAMSRLLRVVIPYILKEMYQLF